jgi:hypothetical protein
MPAARIALSQIMPERTRSLRLGSIEIGPARRIAAQRETRKRQAQRVQPRDSALAFGNSAPG